MAPQIHLGAPKRPRPQFENHCSKDQQHFKPYSDLSRYQSLRLVYINFNMNTNVYHQISFIYHIAVYIHFMPTFNKVNKLLLRLL